MSDATETPPTSRDPSIDQLADLVAASTDRPVTAVHDLVRMTGGSSREIWAFTVEFADGEHSDLVLRRDPPGESRPEGAALEIEIMTAARLAGVPVPRLYLPAAGSGEAERVDGIVMDRVHGETDPQRIIARPDLAGARAVLAAQCGAALGNLHAMPTDTCPDLPTEDRLAAYRATLDRLDRGRPVLELAYQWLTDSPPPARPAVVVHGDFRSGNIAVDESGLTAVLDWESAHIGNRLEDIGWIAIKAWRFRGPGVVGGFGDAAAFLDAYARRTGVEIGPDEFEWALGLNTWIWAVGCLQQADRHLSGAQRSVDLAMVGRRVVEIEHDLLELMP